MISSSQNGTSSTVSATGCRDHVFRQGRTSIKSAARESPQAHSGCIVGHSKTGCLDTITVEKSTTDADFLTTC